MKKQVILNVLKYMKEVNYELSINEPIDKPEILQQGSGDEYCDFDASFIFYVDDPKQTLKFLNSNSMLDKIIKYIQSHKQSILNHQQSQAEFCKNTHQKYNWKWPKPCDDMAFPVQLELEDALDSIDLDYSLNEMGLTYQGEYVGNTEV